MGVMSCHRNGCDSIMCDTYVDGIGYVCFDCQKEFKEYLESNGIIVPTEGDIKRELKKFMGTEKGEFEKGNEISVNDFFSNYTNNH
jgi:hypothetical protein